MQTRALKSLVGVSQAASFVDASKQLGLTLSTLSMQMKALENELGVALFDRSVRPPRLTPLAEVIVEESRSILAHEARLVGLCQPSDRLVGRFRLGFITSAAVRHLPMFLQRAKAAAPNAVFALETGLSATLQERVLQGKLDAAVVTDVGGLPPQLISKSLQSEPFVFAANRNDLDGGLEGLLAQHTFFHFMPDTGIGKLIAQAMADVTRPDGVETIVLDNLEAIMGCVSAGLGFTLLPKPDVLRYDANDVHIMPGPTGFERKLVLVTHTNGPLSQRFETLAGLFRI